MSGADRRRARGGAASPWHLAAAVLALVLILLTAVDWYGSALGDDARDLQELTDPRRPRSDVLEQGVSDRARELAEREERNLWQATGPFDRIVLLAVLLSAALAIVAAVRAARAPAGSGRAGPPGARLAAWSALVTGVLIIVRLFALDEGARIKLGLPLGLAALGLITYTAGRASRAEAAAAARPAAEGAAGGSYNRAR